jgi:CMP-N,N'-diacetyllegionaminic acid synthase
LRILALITARGGSKRIPEKNIRVLGAKPLIVWSIEVVKGIAEICDVLVSTDDSTIAEISRNAGALVPWLRPADLATDTASSIDVCLHALHWYEGENGKLDGLLLLQPTSPFRSRESVVRGIDLFRLKNFRPVLGVSPAASHPMWCFQIQGETLRPFIGGTGFELRSQDLPAAYVVSGAFYLVSPEKFRRLRSFIADDAIPLVIEDPWENIDIDSESDWKMAEVFLAMKESGPK